MENNIKNTFSKISMDETRMKEIRSSLDQKRGIPMWSRAVACVAICMIAMLSIPATRTMIVNAAESIVSIFYTADGGEMKYEEKGNVLSFAINHVDSSYVEVCEDKIYMTVGDDKTDVTEYCGQDSYYRHEILNDDGSKSVLFIGGSVEKVGYVELLFDKKGNYVFNKMKVPAFEDGSVEPWVNHAMHSEGVPCGDIEFDNMLED